MTRDPFPANPPARDPFSADVIRFGSSLTLGSTVTLTSTNEVQLGPLTLHPTEARALLVRLAEVVGAAEHVGDWPAVRDRLDRQFAGALPVTVRDLATQTKGRGLFLRRTDTQADLRLSDYTTAIVRRRPNGRTWTGFVCEWAPDPLFGMVMRGTLRRVGCVVSTRVIA